MRPETKNEFISRLSEAGVSQEVIDVLAEDMPDLRVIDPKTGDEFIPDKSGRPDPDLNRES